MSHLSGPEALAGAVAHAAELHSDLPQHNERPAPAQDNENRQATPLASTVQALNRTAREHPWKTVGIAFGVGLLIGITR